jgi:hypothetical protein
MNSFFLWSIAIRIVIVIGSSHLISNLCGVTPYDQSDTLRDTSAVKVFILAGQSNAVGYNHIKEFSGDRETLEKEIHELTKVIFWPGSNARKEMGNKWINLQIGVSSIAEKEPFLNSCFGPEIGLGLALSKAMPMEDIAIIKYAEGATGIAKSMDYNDYIPALKGFDDKGRNWYPPDGNKNAGLLYFNLMENIKNALYVLKQEERKYKICGFIWMQGEHEAGISKKMAEDYATLLVLFRDAVRKELNKKELPFAIGEINSHTWAYGDIARKKQKEACDEDINSVLIKTTDLPRGGIGGEAHFTADGMLILGSRFARGIFELLDEKTKTTQ